MHSLSATQEWQISTESIAVVVQAFVAGLHELPAHADSSLTVHWTQVPVLQTPLPEMSVQSAFAVQGVQVPLTQADAVSDLQSL